MYLVYHKERYTINIQLLDEYGRIVDLNNMDFSFCVNLFVSEWVT